MSLSTAEVAPPDGLSGPDSRPLRLLLGAFGDPGHAFPMIALGRSLRARGHDVTLQTWERWRAPVEAEGLTFTPAPEYSAFPIDDGPLDFYEAVVYATRDTLPLVGDLRPDAVVHDILTLGPSLAGELLGIPCATLIPHVFPEASPGFPIYSFGARLPRTPLGRAFWSGPIFPSAEASRTGASRSTAPALKSACRLSFTVTAAPLARWRSSPLFPSWSTRARGRLTPTSSARSCGSPRPRRSLSRAATVRSC